MKYCTDAATINIEWKNVNDSPQGHFFPAPCMDESELSGSPLPGEYDKTS